MKRNQKITLAIGIGVVILLNIAIFGWLLADFFSGPNGPEETVSATGSYEQTTDETATRSEEAGSDELTTEESTSVEMISPEPTSVEWIEGEIPLKEAKKLIYTFSWGEGEGQLGYDATDVATGIKPEVFAVEGDTICVLDNANKRVLICENGQYSKIDLSSLSEAWDMRYQNGWIGILDKEDNLTMLYRKDGSVGMRIKTPEKVASLGTVTGIQEIGDTYVVWEIVKMESDTSSKSYRYDWAEDSVKVEAIDKPSVSAEQLRFDVIGIYEGDTYYSYLDSDGYNIINRESDTYRLYAKLDCAIHRANPRKGEYLSADGCLYVMECFADRVEISEIVLDEGEVIIPEETTLEETVPDKESPSAEWTEMEIPISEAKTVIHSFSWGEGDSQLGFYRDFQGREGPNSFVVEEDGIYVLDNVNNRILMCRDGAYTMINLDMHPDSIKYQNKRIAVLDTEKKITGIYEEDGSENILVEIPDELINNGEVSEILGIGDTYVVWKVYMRTIGGFVAYRYDWIDNSLERDEKLEGASVSVSHPFLNIFGSHAGSIYYRYPEDDNKAYVINCETEEDRLYTKLDYSAYRSHPRQMAYLSADGRLYIMECFEDRVEISELILEIGENE